MWGDSWGQMIWGGSVQVPSLHPIGFLGLGVFLIAMGWFVLRRQQAPQRAVWLVALAAVCIPMAAYAGSLAIPNVFVNGTVADANEVNDNFDAVEIEVNDNDARISALEASTFSCTNATQSGSTSPGSPSFTVVACPGGFTMTGGGCDTTGGPGVPSRQLFESYPNGNGWACAFYNSSGSITLPHVTYARCCRFQ